MYNLLIYSLYRRNNKTGLQLRHVRGNVLQGLK